MKSEIKKNGMWWSWVEKCDRCGETIFTHDVQTTREPDMEHPDFCIKCLRHFMDNDIPYDIAKNHL